MISAGELNARLERGDEIRLIDVRQEHEWEIVNLGPQGAELIPLDTLLERLSELDSAEEIVLHCQGGARSMKGPTAAPRSRIPKGLEPAGGDPGVAEGSRPESSEVLAGGRRATPE